MENLNSTKIQQYTQIYELLKSVSYNDYISDKRNNIHQQIYDEAIKKLIEDVNRNVPKTNLGALVKIELNKYSLLTSDEIKEIKHKEMVITVNPITGKQEVNYIDKTYKKIVFRAIEPFNETNFQFIEYKNNNWIYPSKISIIYTKGLVNDKNGNKLRLKIGPYSLLEFWNNDYLTIINIGNMTLGEFYSNFEIEYINYVSGNCKLYDKTNDKNITINLNYIQNQNLKYSDNYKNKLFNKNI